MLRRSLRAFWRKLTIPAAIVFAVAGLAGVGVYNIYSAIIDRSAPIDYLEARAASAEAYAGGTIDIHFDVYRYRICPVARINRILTDSAGIEHAISNYTLASNTRPGRESYDRTITIPDVVAPGLAQYRIRILFACNFVHNLGWPIEVTSPPVNFRVLPNRMPGLELTPLPFPNSRPSAE